MKRSVCKTCKHYLNHYIAYGIYGIIPIDCGHCTHSDGDMKKINCPYYEEAEKPMPKQISVYRKLSRVENSVNYIKESLSEIKKEVKSTK